MNRRDLNLQMESETRETISRILNEQIQTELPQIAITFDDGPSMCTPALRESEIALYDIDEKRLEDSRIILSAINHNVNEDRAVIKTYLGAENRKDALRDADFVVNAIQVGGYEPCTVTDFEIPKKYGIKQTIADTLGIGGIMRALRTIPVLEEFARDMEEVCPNTLFLNYSNPMAMLTGYMQRFTKIRTVGLCHSVQVCSQKLLEGMGMEDKLEGRTELIAGINHMAWLLEIHDKDETTCTRRSAESPRRRIPPARSMRIWYVTSTSVILDTTAQSPVSTMQSIIRSSLNPNIRR